MQNIVNNAPIASGDPYFRLSLFYGEDPAGNTNGKKPLLWRATWKQHTDSLSFSDSSARIVCKKDKKGMLQIDIRTAANERIFMRW